MMKSIVDLIDKCGRRQGFKQLKILDKKRETLNEDDDTAWIAGAEFEDYEEINESLRVNSQNEDDEMDKTDKETDKKQVQEILESKQYESNQFNLTNVNKEEE